MWEEDSNSWQNCAVLELSASQYASFLLSEAQARRGRMKREGREELLIILRDALETLGVFLNLWAL